MQELIKDPFFRVETIAATPNPQQVCWLAAHQDYSENFVFDKIQNVPSEVKAGEYVIKHNLAGGRGHFGVLEHPQITLNVGYFPHSVMQQLRTHRHASFDVQSGRYTGRRILDARDKYYDLCRTSTDGDYDTLDKAFSPIFYLRPVGFYTDRQGDKYEYTWEQRLRDLEWCYQASDRYFDDIESGHSEEHARGKIPFDLRQHFILSANMRALMHLLDLRWKADAQIECQTFSAYLFREFEKWSPAIAEWYWNNRAHKARLAP